MQTITTIKFSPEVDARLRNVSALSHGTGCKFLTCIKGGGDDLVAKQWHRHKPKKLWSWEVVVEFSN